MAEAAEASAPPAPPKSGPGVVTIAIVAFVMSLLAVIAGGYVNAQLHPMPDLKMGKDGLITAVVPVHAAGKEGGEGESKTAGDEEDGADEVGHLLRRAFSQDVQDSDHGQLEEGQDGIGQPKDAEPVVLMIGGGDPDLADRGDLGDQIRFVPAEEEL